MRYSHKQYAEALHEAFQDVNPKNYDTIIENFIEVLKANGDISEYEKIIAEYEAYDKKQQGIKEVEVTTAGLTELNKQLISDLNRIVGDKADIKHKIDESIIGGVVVRVDDTLIDGSVKNQLENLEDTLKE